MDTSVAEQNRATREIGLREFGRVMWRYRLLFAIVTSVCVVIAGIGGAMSVRKYKASVVFSVAEDQLNAMSGLTGMISQLGPLATLAAGSLMGNTDQKSEAVAVLQSRALTNAFVQENDLLPVLFADRWDPVAKKWIVDRPEDVPTLWKANEAFKKIRSVVQDNKTGLLTLSITWTDPQLAAKWANELVERANRHMQQRAIADSRRNLKYLNEQATQADSVELRNAIYKLIEREIQQVMLAQGNSEYALRIIDPAVPPETPSSSGMRTWLAGGLLGGLLISALFALLREAWNDD